MFSKESYPIFFILIASTEALKQIEMGFLISGNDKFGGEVRQRYHNDIRNLINKTTRQFGPHLAEFGAAWTYPGGVWPFKESTSINTVVNLTADRGRFYADLNNYMALAPASRLSNQAGLEGSLAYLEKHLFKQQPWASKVAMTLVHEQISYEEVRAFLWEKCTPILTYVIVFPKHGHACETESVQQVVDWFNTEMPYNSIMTYNRAMCSLDDASIFTLSENVWRSLPELKRALATCSRYKPTTPAARTAAPKTHTWRTTTPRGRVVMHTSVRRNQSPSYESPWYTQIPIILLGVIVVIGIVIGTAMISRMIYDAVTKKPGEPRFKPVMFESSTQYDFREMQKHSSKNANLCVINGMNGRARSL